MNGFQKRQLTLRQYLIGARYHDALSVMEFVSGYHTGTRKCGIIPEWDHQVGIALYALTLPDVMHREDVIATIFAHDTPEDYGVHFDEIKARIVDQDRATRVAHSVNCMTKEFRGEKRDEAMLFDMMANDANASIAKGCDRINNFGSMSGVFSAEKQRSYIDEGKRLFLPMLKKARRNFPHQTMAYENIKFVLKSQISLLEHALDSADPRIGIG